MDPTVVSDSFTQLEFARAPAALWRLLAIAGLVAFVIWTWRSYRLQARQRLSSAATFALVALRIAVVLVLTLIALDPVQARYEERVETSGVAVLCDDSASMSANDVVTSGERRTRQAAVTEIVDADASRALAGLAAGNRLRVYTFGAEPSELTPPAAPDGTRDWSALQLELRAAATRTDIGRALRRAVADLGTGPIAGVVLVSDGNINAGLGPEELAGLARQYQLPVYPVEVGATGEPPNRRIVSVSAPLSASVGDPVSVEVEVAAQALPADAPELELWREPLAEDGPPTLLESRTIEIGGEGTRVHASFRLNFDSPGEYVLTARVGLAAGEVLERDNAGSAIVRVIDDRLRVLLVSGRPSYDARYVTRLLERDELIDVAVWLQSADARAVRDGNTVLTELPRNPEELFAFDTILLLDVDPGELDSAWALAVRRFVDEFSGGLLVQAGGHHTTRFLGDPRLVELIAILPVKPDPQADLAQSREGAFSTRATRVYAPDDVRAHPLLRPPDTAGHDLDAFWRSLPGLWWRLPTLGEKPLATVLLRAVEPTRPGAERDASAVLAVQPFGGGRTGFLTSDDTWRWRAVDEAAFDRFWVQLTRYLAQGRRQQGVSRRGQIVLDRDEIYLGDLVSIQARVLDDRFVPWQARTIEAALVPDDGAPTQLAMEAIPGRDGWFAAQARFDFAGRGRVVVPLPGLPAADGATELTRRVHVLEPTTELESLALRRDTLQQLAAGTGGRVLTLAEFGRLPELIQPATVHTSVRTGASALWDSPLVFAALALLLAAEWFVRRRNHLL